MGGPRPVGWLCFFTFSIGVVLVGTSLQNAALRRLKASFNTSLQAWRLVIRRPWQRCCSGVVHLCWQVIGALVVMATITWYSRPQNIPPAPLGRVTRLCGRNQQSTRAS